MWSILIDRLYATQIWSCQINQVDILAHNPAVVNVYPVLHVVHVVAEAHDAQFVTAEQSVITI